MPIHRFVAEPEPPFWDFSPKPADNPALMFLAFVLLLGVAPVWPVPEAKVPASTVWITLPPPNPFEESIRKRRLSAEKFRWPKPH